MYSSQDLYRIGGVLAKGHKNVFRVAKLAQRRVLEGRRESKELKIEVAPPSRTIIEAAPLREYIYIKIHFYF
jgi:hypothetical protein